MSTGQPFTGFTPALGELAFGTVTNTGIWIVSVATGTGLKRVRKVLVASSGEGPPCHAVSSGAVGFASLGRDR